MKLKLLLFSVMALFSLSIGAAYAGYRADDGLDFALYKNYSSPAYIPNVNGLLTIPIADTIGTGVGIAFNGIDAGTLDGTDVYYSTGTLVLGLLDKLEVGITKKALVYADDMSRTDIGGTTFHSKVNILDLPVIPKISAGIIASSLTDENDFNQNNTFMDIFGVASTQLEVAGLDLGLHIGAESGFIGDTQSDLFLFAGVALKAFDFLNLYGEYIGARDNGEDGVINASAGFVFWDVVNVNISSLDLANNDDDPKLSGQIAATFSL